MVSSALFCLLALSQTVLALETPLPQTAPLQIEEDCVETNSVSSQAPSNQLLQHVDVLKNIMKNQHDSRSIVFDGKESVCEVYSDDCDNPIEETFIKTPQALQDVKMVLVNNEQKAGSDKPETLARAIDENANLIQINSETQEQTKIEFSDPIKEILSQANGRFDPSGKAYKLSGLTDEQKQQLREELSENAIQENSQTGEVSVDLDRVFESSAKQPLKQTSSDKSLDSSSTSIGGETSWKSAEDFGSLNSIREQICQRVEKMHPESSAFYQDCVQRGLIEPKGSLRSTGSSWSANILRSARSMLTPSTSRNQKWPSAFSPVYPRPISNSLQTSELQSMNAEPSAPSSSPSLVSGRESMSSNANPSGTLKISDASEIQKSRESDYLADQAMKEMVAALTNARPDSELKKDDRLPSALNQSADLHEQLQNISSLSPSNKVLVAEALSLRNMVRDFKESQQASEMIQKMPIFGMGSSSQTSTDSSSFDIQKDQLSSQVSDAQPTSGQEKNSQSPSKGSEVEIPLFVLPERRRYAPELPSDEPPQT